MLDGVAGATDRALPDVVHVTVYGTPSDDPMVAFAPAIVAFFLYFFVYLLTGVSFLRERTGGTLERLMATPVTRGEVVDGLPVRLRAVRGDPGRRAADLVAGLARGAGHRAAARVLASASASRWRAAR